MNADLEKLEHEVEREMGLLAGLPAVAPSPACVARLKNAVVAEARRTRRLGRVLRLVQVGLSAAAAIVLVAGLTSRGPRPAGGMYEADAALGEWSAAWDESNQCLASVVERSWYGGDARGGDEAAELDDLLRSLDQSFESMGALEGS